jgi:heme/copper-type cytochrome/quinol oxidase subunit 2
MSGGKRLGLLGVLIAAAVVAFVIVSSGGDDNKSSTSTRKGPTAPTHIQINVRGAKPVGGVKKISVSKGDRVRFAVTSDVADEIHVHGYDFMKDVEAGRRVRFNFPATIAGNFEIELESRKEQIAALQVKP